MNKTDIGLYEHMTIIDSGMEEYLDDFSDCSNCQYFKKRWFFSAKCQLLNIKLDQPVDCPFYKRR